VASVTTDEELVRHGSGALVREHAREGTLPPAPAAKKKKQVVGPNFRFCRDNYSKLLEIDLFFFFNKTFGELPNYKIWKTKCLKLLEML